MDRAIADSLTKGYPVRVVKPTSVFDQQAGTVTEVDRGIPGHSARVWFLVRVSGAETWFTHDELQLNALADRREHATTE